MLSRHSHNCKNVAGACHCTVCLFSIATDPTTLVKAEQLQIDHPLSVAQMRPAFDQFAIQGLCRGQLVGIAVGEQQLKTSPNALLIVAKPKEPAMPASTPDHTGSACKDCGNATAQRNVMWWVVVQPATPLQTVHHYAVVGSPAATQASYPPLKSIKWM
jgi:hypothetical protein